MNYYQQMQLGHTMILLIDLPQTTISKRPTLNTFFIVKTWIDLHLNKLTNPFEVPSSNFKVAHEPSVKLLS